MKSLPELKRIWLWLVPATPVPVHAHVFAGRRVVVTYAGVRLTTPGGSECQYTMTVVHN